jgi:hypothetical protein
VLSQQVALLAEGLAQWMNTCKCDCKGCAELIVAIAKVGQIKMKKYPEGFVIKWNDSTLGKPIFGKTIYYEHGKAVEAAKNVSKSSGGYTIVACSEHRDDEIPSGSCHYCAMLQPKISTTESEENARDFIERNCFNICKRISRQRPETLRHPFSLYSSDR